MNHTEAVEPHQLWAMAAQTARVEDASELVREHVLWALAQRGI